MSPAIAPIVAHGQRALALLHRGDQTTLFLFDALGTGTASPAGAITWAKEIPLRLPCPAVVAKGRTWVAGERDGLTVVFAIGNRGQLLWDRRVPCDARTVALVPFEGGVIASDARGACVRLLPDGEIDWVLGSGGDQLAHRLAPRIVRKVLIVPGPVTRWVDPAKGRVLSELAVGPHVTDVAVDRQLHVYVYSEPGSLQRYTAKGLLLVL